MYVVSVTVRSLAGVKICKNLSTTFGDLIFPPGLFLVQQGNKQRRRVSKGGVPERTAEREARGRGSKTSEICRPIKCQDDKYC